MPTDDPNLIGLLNEEALHDPNIAPPRIFINPLRGLRVERAIAMLEMAQYGYFADLQWTYKLIEKRHHTISALKRRRMSAIGKLKPTFVVKDEAKDDENQKAEADKQIAALKEVYGRITNLREAIRFLALATFRGFAHLEKRYDASGNITKLEKVEQWYWCRTYPFNDWRYNRDAYQTNIGVEVDPNQFVVREVEDPLDELCLIIFLRVNMSMKDWDGYNETYGTPSIFAVAPPGATTADMASTVATLERIISRGKGALPPGWGITSTSQSVGSASTSTFEAHLNYYDKAIVLAGTGGMLTMLNEATGIGGGASEQHESVFDDIAKDEAEEVCHVLNESITLPELKRLGFNRPLVEMQLEKTSIPDRKSVAELLATLSSAGWTVDEDEARELLELEVHNAMQQNGQEGEQQGDEGQSVEQDQGDGSGGGINLDDFIPVRNRGESGTWTSSNVFTNRPRRAGVPIPRYPAVGVDASVAEPDPPPYLFGYPVAGQLDKYKAGMRKSIAQYQRRIAAAMKRDLDPVRAELESILRLDNAQEMIEGLLRLNEKLPAKLKSLLKSSASADELRAALEESLARGATNPHGAPSFWQRVKNRLF